MNVPHGRRPDHGVRRLPPQRVVGVANPATGVYDQGGGGGSIVVSADDVLALSGAATSGTHQFPGRGPVAPPSTTAAGEHPATAVTVSHARA